MSIKDEIKKQAEELMTAIDRQYLPSKQLLEMEQALLERHNKSLEMFRDWLSSYGSKTAKLLADKSSALKEKP